MRKSEYGGGGTGCGNVERVRKQNRIVLGTVRPDAYRPHFL